MRQSDPNWAERQQHLLQRAQDAAERGDAFEAVEAVFASGTLDNVYRLVRSRFRDLSFEDVADAIAEAVDAYLFAVRDGKTIRDTRAYVYKAAMNNAIDLANNRKMWTELSAEIEHGTGQSMLTESSARQLARSEALRVAREIVSKLGLTRVRQVMSYIIEALAQGAEEVTNQEISEALSLSIGTVKVNRSRGFERLAREASAMGCTLDIERLQEIYADDAGNGEGEPAEESDDE